jgi:hypothetical protein
MVRYDTNRMASGCGVDHDHLASIQTSGFDHGMILAPRLEQPRAIKVSQMP